MTRPPHHRADGRFRAPWPEAAGDDEMRDRIGEVALEWIRTRMPPDPRPEQLPLATPRITHPHLEHGAGITWAGHASFLIQLPGLNVLTDPVWSKRPSPVSFAGTPRFVPAVPALEALPRIDAVLLSHDHYDHLDRATVRALHRRFGDDLAWYAPLGFAEWLGKLGIRHVYEADWWDQVDAPGGGYTFTAAPARHWCRRKPWDTNRRLWCSWALRPADADAGTSVYFGGDSAYASCFTEIGSRLGPFDACLLPIGAYEPRWFMAASHVNPEEAVQVYRDLGEAGVFVPMH